MIKFSKKQLDTWLQQDKETFIARIVDHIHKEMPDEVRGIPQHVVWAMVECGLERARHYGLTKDGQLAAYIAVMFEIAPNFDEDPEIQQILHDHSLTVDERWSKLFSAQHLQLAWERAADPTRHDASAWFKPVPRHQVNKSWANTSHALSKQPPNS